MRRVAGVILDILVLSAIALGIVALWGLLPTESREEAPATVRVIQGTVSTLTPGGREQSVGSLASLDPGASLRVAAGAEAFLLYADGSVSRTLGPAEVTLQESTRTVKKPAVLTRLLSVARRSSPPSPDEVTVVVKAGVLRGEVITKVAPLSSRNSMFQAGAPTSFVSAGGASFILTVRDNGETSVEVGQGPVSVAMVAAGEDSVVPVIIPQLASRTGILIPALPAGKATSKETVGLRSRLEALVPRLNSASGPISMAGIDFREVRSGDVPYLVGDPAYGARSRYFAAADPSPELGTAIEEQTRIPGSETFVLTDRDIGANIPPPFPPDARVHILAGNSVKVDTGDVTLVVSIAAVDGRLEVRGLPFGINPDQISEAIAARTGAGGQTSPTVLAVSSEPGRLTFTYAKDVLVRRAAGSGSEPEEVAPSLPRTTEYFKAIPTPREVSTDWKVVGSNILLAGIIAYLLKVFLGFANAFVTKREEHMASGLGRVVQGMRRVTGWQGVRGRAMSWFSTARFTRSVLMMFVFGGLYSFLSNGAGLFGPGGLVVFLTLSLTAGFFALYEPWVRALSAKRMKMAARVALYPGQVVVAFFSVAVSRLFSFTPGLMLGQPGGLEMSEGGATPKQKLKLAIVSLAAVAGLGAAAWVVVYVLPVVARQQWARGLFQTVPGLSSWVQDWCLAAFAMAVQRVFFELLPMPWSTGQEILKRNVIAWGIPFALVLFLFIHTQINRQKGLLELTPMVWVTLAVAVVVGVTAQVYTSRRKRDKSSVAEASETKA
ncbi:MAG: hypothetical protein HY671_07225 [Chloroflexi bacterium]|nr:hypothetical protein [Chloroflexota bacterium]